MKSPTRDGAGRRAFTLVELLVVIAIIGILVSIMITVGASVNKSAGAVATKGLMQTLDTGLQSFRTERQLGGLYPPSHTDNPNGGAVDVLLMNNPFAQDPSTLAFVAGSNLLVYAMVGADQLGTAGFLDHNKSGNWYDDMHAVNSPPGQAGAYGLDPDTVEPIRTRYPSRGTTYVDDQSRERIRSLDRMKEEGTVVAMDDGPVNQNAGPQLSFTDNWGRPVLYYRANPAGRVMLTAAGRGARDSTTGVYDLRDNAVFTGHSSLRMAGADFGPGYASGSGNARYASAIAIDLSPNLKPTTGAAGNEIETSNTYDGSFARYIHDRSVTNQNRPVNPNTYLLISAGPDAVYGTLDDVVNWERGE